MNILDAGIIFVIFMIMVQSFRAGFLDELLSLVVFVVGGYLSFTLSAYLIPHLDFITNNYIVLKVIAVIILFILFFILGKLVKIFILDAVDETELNGFDRFMGMILGFLKGVVIISLLLIIVSYFNVTPVKNLIQASYISNKILYAVAEYKHIILNV
jgi:membrane protein required for colicin V production